MFEREIKFIYDFNLNKVNKLGPYFTFEQLLSADLHPAILCYISAEIDFLIFEDRQKLLKNSAFDYSGEKITFHFNQITDEVKRIKRFSVEYIAKLILHATSFNINYLVRPKWTISKFIYDESKHKTTNEIKQILNYVHYYKYLRKIIISYINSKKILSMNLEEFEALLAKTDKLGLESNFKGIMASSLESIAEFFNIGQMQKTKIPLAAVQLFLEEKDLPYHLQKLEDVLGLDENARYSFIDYMKVINSVSVKKESEVEKTQENLLLFDQQEEIIDDENEPELEMKMVQEQEEPVILDSKFDEEIGDDIDIINGKEVTAFENENEINENIEKEKISEIDDELEEEVGFINRIEQIKAEIEKEEKSGISSVVSPEIEKKEKIESELLSIQEKIEVVDPSEDEIKIKQNTKFRIKINENNNLEPLFEEDPNLILSNNEVDDADENSFGISDVLDIQNQESDISLDFRDIAKDDDSGEYHEIVVDTILKNDQQSIELEELVEEESAQPSFYTDLKEAELEFESHEKNENEDLIADEVENDDYIAFEKKDNDGNLEAKFDLNELLEHHNMTRIIEVIFDYDIEDFSNAIDEISKCRNIDDANFVINEIFSNHTINKNSKEAVSFKEIIAEYFNR